MSEINDFQFKVILQCEPDKFNPTKQYCEYLVEMNGVERPLRDILKENIEQQDTIRKLQDLCGESDYENAKLRIENKKLKAKLKEKEEDEQLYANEIVKLNKEAKEVLDFKSLGGDY